MPIWKYTYLDDPGMLPGSADQCVLGNLQLKSDLSRKHWDSCRVNFWRKPYEVTPYSRRVPAGGDGT